MRRLIFVAAILFALIASPYATGKHTLRHRIVKLERNLACLQKIPVSQFYDYAWYDADPGYPNWALVWDYDGPPAQSYMLSLRETRRCRRAFPLAVHPVPPLERSLSRLPVG